MATEQCVRPIRMLFVRNLSKTTTSEKLSAVFEDVGPIKQCFIVTDRGSDTCKGFGYVKFSLLEDAVTAKDTIRSLDGRPIFIDFADHKRKISRKRNVGESEYEVEPKRAKTDSQSDTKHVQQAKIVCLSGFNPKYDFDDINELANHISGVESVEYPVKNRLAKTAFLTFDSIREAKLGVRQLNDKLIDNFKLTAVSLGEENNKVHQLKQCRLIIRNLSFQLPEAELRSKFQVYGNVVEVNIPLRRDGKKSGFGFVQFDGKKSAQTAISAMNGKKLWGRQLVVDWSLSKKDYEAQRSELSAESEHSEHSVSEDDSDLNDQNSDDENSKDNEGSDDNEDSEDNGDVESEVDSESNDETSSEDNGDSSDAMSTKQSNFEGKILKRKSDVSEGKTLFIRNVPFNCEEEDLQDLFSDFGNIEFCKLVIDPVTQHPKGTAFVKFEKSDDAEKCLTKAENTDVDGEMVLLGRPLKISKAVDKESVKDFQKEKPKKVDKRNLFLIREGLVRGGSQDLSTTDIAMRKNIEMEIRQKLKNPNIFVSSTRLCVQNLPVGLSDKAFRKLMANGADDKNVKVIECRIMRDLNRIGSDGKGRSRGYGFVEFSEHSHALKALHAWNNKSSTGKRLIVNFALEDQRKLLIRRKKMERIVASKEKVAAEKSQIRNRNVKQLDKQQSKHDSKKLTQDNIARKLYTGPKGLPSHSGLKVRHTQRSNKTVKNNKTKRGKPEVFRARDMESNRSKKKTIGKGDAFDKLVESYKNKISLNQKSKKWFE